MRFRLDKNGHVTLSDKSVNYEGERIQTPTSTSTTETDETNDRTYTNGTETKTTIIRVNYSSDVTETNGVTRTYINKTEPT